MRLSKIITAPFRLIIWPFKAVRDFINYEPADSNTIDAFGKAFEQPSVLVEHLDALRHHLLRGLLVLAVTTGFSFIFAQQILNFLAVPIGGLESLQAIEVTESIGAFMRVSLLTGFAIAFPYLIFEVFAFLNPGLKRSERVFLLVTIPVAFALFLGGLAFAYFIMLPAALDFLIGFLGIEARIRPSNYIKFVTNLMFWIGLAFQFPLVVFALASVGMVKAKSLLAGWRFAMVGIAILSAAVTPTIDPVNMALVMAPMIVLYFLGVLFAAIANAVRRRANR
jgi:sec-independent protein translocase protein TatC